MVPGAVQGFGIAHYACSRLSALKLHQMGSCGSWKTADLSLKWLRNVDEALVTGNRGRGPETGEAGTWLFNQGGSIFPMISQSKSQRGSWNVASSCWTKASSLSQGDGSLGIALCLAGSLLPPAQSTISPDLLDCYWEPGSRLGLKCFLALNPNMRLPEAEWLAQVSQPVGGWAGICTLGCPCAVSFIQSSFTHTCSLPALHWAGDAGMDRTRAVPALKKPLASLR